MHGAADRLNRALKEYKKYRGMKEMNPATMDIHGETGHQKVRRRNMGTSAEVAALQHMLIYRMLMELRADLTLSGPLVGLLFLLHVL